MLFNINDYCRVRLTEHGKQIHKENWESFMAGHGYDYTPPKEDAEGWSQWQMWNLMSTFGEHIHLGMREPPFSIEIDIVER